MSLFCQKFVYKLVYLRTQKTKRTYEVMKANCCSHVCVCELKVTYAKMHEKMK